MCNIYQKYFDLHLNVFAHSFKTNANLFFWNSSISWGKDLAQIMQQASSWISDHHIALLEQNQ